MCGPATSIPTTWPCPLCHPAPPSTSSHSRCQLRSPRSQVGVSRALVSGQLFCWRAGLKSETRAEAGCAFDHADDVVTLVFIIRVGQNHINTVYIRHFWQGNYQIYGHIRCIYTVLANPIHARGLALVTVYTSNAEGCYQGHR